MQTGLYSHSNEVITNGIPLIPQHPTLADLFNQTGYETCYIGKWHLSGCLRGFKKYIDNLELNKVPIEQRAGWKHWYGQIASLGHFSHFIFKDGDIVRRKLGWEPRQQVNNAINFIKNRRNDRWILYLSLSPPHLPQGAPKSFLDLYDREMIHPPIKNLIPNSQLQTYQIAMFNYYAQISAIDHEIGRVLKTLREYKQYENTVVVYTSDHGDLLGHHQEQQGRPVRHGSGIRRLRGKRMPSIHAISVPLVIQWPLGIKSGQVSNALMSSVDLPPTILDLAGIDVPDYMQGQSMAGWCTRANGPVVSLVYLETDSVKRGWRGVWDGRYLLGFGANQRRLYDHLRDPHELNNLYDNHNFQDVKHDLFKNLCELAKKTEDPYAKDLPAFDNSKS